MSSEKGSNRSVNESTKGIREVRDFERSGDAMHRTKRKLREPAKWVNTSFQRQKTAETQVRGANISVCPDENFAISVKSGVV